MTDLPPFRRLGHRAGHRAGGLALVLAVAGALAAPPALAARDRHAGPAPSTYLVGADEESLNPSAAMLRTGAFYLGGYGLGDGRVGGLVQVLPGRAATGILGTGVHTRALAISDGATAIVTAQIESQGVFAAYKTGPFGIEDMRKDAAAAITAAHPSGPRIGPGQILVDSNHTHAGPDTAGVWGGVPTAYLQHVHDQTVAAIVRAYAAMVPAHLSFATALGGVNGKAAHALVSNQFSDDPLNQVVDDELRVLQARSARTGKVIATYLNFSVHPTVLGGGNTLVSADYTGVLDGLLAGLGGIGFEQIGTLGRTQPTDRGCANPRLKDAAASQCTLDDYAGRVFARVRTALATAIPLTGRPVVALHSYLMLDPDSNAPLISLIAAGSAIGAPVLRQTTPPWFTGNLLGAPSFSGRIGDILLSGSPGEPYPQIPRAVRDAVPGMRGYLSIGTAGDFLGYIVAPFEAYPEPIRRSLLSGGPPPTNETCNGVPSPVGCPNPVGNDNYFFNQSHTFGERLICSLLRGAGEVTGKGTSYRDARSRCALFPNDLLLAADADTTYSTGPYQPLPTG